MSWSVEASHHKVMQAARDRVFADYRMHIGEFISDTQVPAGQQLLQQRLDVTAVGAGKAITLLDAKHEPEWLKQTDIDAVVKSLGFNPGVSEIVTWDVFDALAEPGQVIALVKWGDIALAESFQQSVVLPEGVRLRTVRVVRDYGMYDRREAPQYFTEARPKP